MQAATVVEYSSFQTQNTLNKMRSQQPVIIAEMVMGHTLDANPCTAYRDFISMQCKMKNELIEYYRGLLKLTDLNSQQDLDMCRRRDDLRAELDFLNDLHPYTLSFPGW